MVSRWKGEMITAPQWWKVLHIYASTIGIFGRRESKLPISRTPQSYACLPRQSTMIHLRCAMNMNVNYASLKKFRKELTLTPPAILGEAFPGISDGFLQSPHCSTICQKTIRKGHRGVKVNQKFERQERRFLDLL